MKARRKLTLVAAVSAVPLAVGFAAAWVLWGPFSFEPAAAKAKKEAVLLNGSDPHSYCLVITRDGEEVRTLVSRSQIDKTIGQYLADVTAMPANGRTCEAALRLAIGRLSGETKRATADRHSRRQAE